MQTLGSLEPLIKELDGNIGFIAKQVKEEGIEEGKKSVEATPSSVPSTKIPDSDNNPRSEDMARQNEELRKYLEDMKAEITAVKQDAMRNVREAEIKSVYKGMPNDQLDSELGLYDEPFNTEEK